MDEKLRTEAVRAAEILTRRPELLRYVDKYYEHNFLQACLGSAGADEREEAYQLMFGVKNAIASLKLLSEEETDNE